MLKIIFANWRDIANPEAGGAEVHLHEVTKRIAAAGHQVTVLASSFKGAAREETLDGVRVVRQGGKFAFNYGVPSALRRLIARDGCDVVVDDINKIPFYTPLYIRKPVLALTHHLFGRTIFLETAFPLAAYVYLSEALIPSVYKRTSIVTVSESTRQELVNKGLPGGNITVIHNAVDHSVYSPGSGPKPEAPLIAYLGRIKRYKRVGLVLDAAKLVFAEFPGARLVVVGSGDFLPNLVRQAGELGIADRVEFTGFLGEEAKVDVLRRAHVVVNPSAKEGWGVTVTEANACGTPVVASDVPGLKDAVVDGKTGFLVPYGDAGAFASKISQVLGDRALRERLSAAAVEWARTFNWDRSAEAILKLIERLAAGGGKG